MALIDRAKSKLTSRYMGNLNEFNDYEDIQKQYWGWLIFNHRYSGLVDNTISVRYPRTWEDTYKFIDPTNNVLKRVALIKAQTYSRPPLRRAKSAQLQRLISNNVHRINNALNQACRLLNACGNVLIVPVLASDKGIPSILDILVIPPHEVYLEPCYIDYQFNLVARVTDKVYIVSEIDSDSVESRRNTYIVNLSKDKSIGFSDIGDPVWVSLQNTTLLSPRSVGPIADLISGTIHIGELEAFEALTAWLKSFKQLQRVDDERVNDSDLIAGPKQLWPSNVQALDIIDKSDIFERIITQKAIDLAGQHGVSKTAILGDYQSENNWFSVSQELLHHWVSQLENWKETERKLWAAVASMTLISVAPEEAEVITTFSNPYLSLQDPQKDWDLHRQKVKQGYESTLTKILEENPHLSGLEEAEAFYRANLATYAEEIKMKRELNIPEGDDPGKSPVDNGKMGVLGKAGPSLVNKDDLEA